MKKTLQWFNDNFEMVICCMALIIVSVSVMIQVFCRYVLNNALSWPEELSCYAMIWYSMVGIGYATQKGQHLKMDAFINLLPEKARAFFNLLADIALFGFFVYIVRYGVECVLLSMREGQLSPAMRLPMWIVQFSLLLGAALSIIHLICKWVVKFTGKKEEKTC